MQDSVDFQLIPQDQSRLSELLGQMNSNVGLIESQLSVNIANRGHLFRITGEEGRVAQARFVIEHLYQQTGSGVLNQDDVHLALRDAGATLVSEIHAHDVGKDIRIETKRGTISGRGTNQRRYLKRIFEHAVNFGVGPAGTGKTYLAVAAAVSYLAEDKVRKVVLVRPAVEAGERLGFLPGDMTQKVDPYLRPLYDALNDMLGAERVSKLMERGVIEIAPLAFMRGRTLNDAFIILDEAQNTTVEQMKMFLTRQGFGSTSVITGDPTQIDLPKGVTSGLKHAVRVLANVEGISFTRFEAEDVVRHPLVQRIIEAYDKQMKADEEKNDTNNN
ncbi:PhoH family protein [Suttonella ornithocola]|uniref:PhoH-like protein n=1 Tax=Suttonella ornithocola TaxID=279832 RepID=A0A380MSP3_9GAMM|nr:PhoH family protein [Suttonella ornithocola]SUO94923.1 PhoH-like protein [Suttonella ornithocola]